MVTSNFQRTYSTSPPTQQTLYPYYYNNEWWNTGGMFYTHNHLQQNNTTMPTGVSYCSQPQVLPPPTPSCAAAAASADTVTSKTVSAEAVQQSDSSAATNDIVTKNRHEKIFNNDGNDDNTESETILITPRSHQRLPHHNYTRTPFNIIPSLEELIPTAVIPPSPISSSTHSNKKSTPTSNTPTKKIVNNVINQSTSSLSSDILQNHIDLQMLYDNCTTSPLSIRKAEEVVGSQSSILMLPSQAHEEYKTAAVIDLGSSNGGYDTHGIISKEEQIKSIITSAVKQIIDLSPTASHIDNITTTPVSVSTNNNSNVQQHCPTLIIKQIHTPRNNSLDTRSTLVAEATQPVSKSSSIGSSSQAVVFSNTLSMRKPLRQNHQNTDPRAVTQAVDKNDTATTTTTIIRPYRRSATPRPQRKNV